MVEQLLRLMHHCGMPAADVDLLHGPGTTMGEVLKAAQPRNTLFTGSQRVAERLAVEMHGKVRGRAGGRGWVWGGPGRLHNDVGRPQGGRPVLGKHR